MVATLLARAWLLEPSGNPTPPPPPPPPPEAPLMDVVRSARERRFSDQLKPSPVAEEAMVSRLLLNGILNEVREGADAGREEEGGSVSGSEDKPRPWLSREEIVPLDDGMEVDSWRACCDEGAGGGKDLPFAGGLPSPPPPLPPVEDLISRMARAPKLIRRANGVVGWSREANSSSMADSSMLPLFAELKLSRRPRIELKGDWAVGDPDSPSVVNDMRLRWAWAAAVVMGPGYWPC